MTKAERKQAEAVAPLGYDYVGQNNGHNHNVFVHREHGRVITASRRTQNQDQVVKWLVKQAKQANRQSESLYGQFVDWLIEREGIKPDETRVVSLHLHDVGDEFYRGLSNPPKLGHDPAKWLRALERDSRAEKLKVRRGVHGGVSDWRLSGALVGVEAAENEAEADPVAVEEQQAYVEGRAPVYPTCDEQLALAGGGIAVCSREPGHDGPHLDELRHVSWGDEQQMDAAPTEPTPEPQQAEGEAPTPEPEAEAAEGRTDAQALIYQALAQVRLEAAGDANAKLALVGEALDAMIERTETLAADLIQLKGLIDDAE